MSLMPHAAWVAEGERRFGPDRMEWKFVCPACGHIARTADWKEAGAPEGAVAFSCVGRWLPNSGPGRAFATANVLPSKPCDYAGGGLFGLNPLLVEDLDGKSHRLFAFAKEPA
jgi:hypothetical protein